MTNKLIVQECQKHTSAFVKQNKNQTI